MATAKKKAPSKRRVVSKKATKKKVSKKRTTRAIKKAPKKKTVRQKRKTVVKKKTTKAAAKSRKLKVKNADKSRSFKVRIQDNCREITVPVKTVFNPGELKIKSREQHSEQYHLSQFARFSGVTAVFVGAIFTLINMQAILGFDPNLNTLQGATVAGGSQTYSDEQVDERPDARISIDSSGGVLKEIVKVHITVPYAHNIGVLAEHLETDAVLPIGHAQKLDETSWKFDWNTTEFLDGEYELKIIIHNDFGEYDQTGGIIYTIQNEITETPTGDYDDEKNPDLENSSESLDPDSENNDGADLLNNDTKESEDASLEMNSELDSDPAIAGNDDEIEDANEISAEENIPDQEVGEDDDGEVVLRVKSSTDLRKILDFEINTPPTDEVRLYAKNKDSLGLSFLGFASDKGDGVWEFKWDTETVVDGQYELYAVIASGNEQQRSDFVEVKVLNDNKIADAPISEEGAEDDGEKDGEDKLFDPEIEIKVPDNDYLSNSVILTARTTPVQWLEFYVVPKKSQILKFIGLGKNIDGEIWKLTWDTRQVPNGEYLVYARVKTEFGFTESGRQELRIRNEIATELSDEQERHVDDFLRIEEELIDVIDQVDEVDNVITREVTDRPRPIIIDPTESFVESIDLEEEEQQQIEMMLDRYRDELHILLNDLGKATRANDLVLLEVTKEEMEKLKRNILLELSSDNDKKEIVDTINAYISKITFELEEVTIRNEKILKERIGERLYTDTDNDSISDYDEINLYKTNPFNADSDGDGFIDGAEIQNGYNPNDSSNEALIAYESPKNSGVEQKDLFAINTITTLNEESEVGQQKKAVITGKGLPNSFVTIYIFSTPIIVTVRTDADGSWQYVFDKELENGEHEIYVGVTDNAGKIVGKSEPMTFVKTAEAFTLSEEAEQILVAPAQIDESLISGRMLLLIASLAVVSIGLVLILLGIYVSDQRKLEVIEAV